MNNKQYELYPEEHCLKAPELLREGGVGEDIIHAVCSHGYGITAGCDRGVIERGAEQLGWELDKLLTMTLQAMAATEDEIQAQVAAL